jgi:OmpA-OmpF porin, OOP family
MNDPMLIEPERLTPPALRLSRLNPGLCAICVVAFMSTPTAASAQTRRVYDEFSVERFDPAPGPRNFFVTRTARSDGQKTWSAGLVLDFASRPFTIQTCDAQQNCSDPNSYTNLRIVESMVTGHLMGSFTPVPQLQLGLSIPVTYMSGQGLDRATFSNVPGGTKAFAISDPMLEGKYRFLGRVDSPLAAAIGAFVTAPTGSAMAKEKYLGDRSVTAGLRGIADIQLRAFSVAGNITGVAREPGKVGDAKIGSEIRGSLAAGYQVSPVLKVVLETFGNSRLEFKDNGTSSLEGLFGAQVTPMGMPVLFTAGVGTGLVRGIGAPNFRGFLGAVFMSENRDRDGDGISDEKDQCPTAAEDFDGFEDSDGCPDLDNDGDGIPDVNDKCPNAAEDMDGFEDQDGCPEVDNDKDGIPDDVDHCPNEPETKNGYKDQDGCPDEADSDGDGVPDARDKCPNEMEDTDGFQDDDGCPDLDNDNDGIPDDKDECLDEPETINGYLDQDGCPDEAPELDPKKLKAKAAQEAKAAKAKAAQEAKDAKAKGAEDVQDLDEPKQEKK